MSKDCTCGECAACRDEAAVDTRLQDAAEKLDTRQQLVNDAATKFREVAREAIRLVSMENPSPQTVKRAEDMIVRAVLAECVAAQPRVQNQAKRQAERAKRAFAKRSGKRIKLPMITRAEKKRRIEEMREVKAKRVEPPKRAPRDTEP